MHTEAGRSAAPPGARSRTSRRLDQAEDRAARLIGARGHGDSSAMRRRRQGGGGRPSFARRGAVMTAISSIGNAKAGGALPSSFGDQGCWQSAVRGFAGQRTASLERCSTLIVVHCSRGCGWSTTSFHLMLGARAAAGARADTVVDGLDMLIGQAALAFELFFGAEPSRDRDEALRELLRNDHRRPHRVDRHGQVDRRADVHAGRAGIRRRRDRASTAGLGGALVAAIEAAFTTGAQGVDCTALRETVFGDEAALARLLGAPAPPAAPMPPSSPNTASARRCGHALRAAS